MQPAPPPRMQFAWLAGLLVVAVWWPMQTFWQSDDWIALHYAADPARAVSDFWGNQYGLSGVVWFYRPLITLSFALDAAVGGGDPFFSHLSNAVAHGFSAMLLGLLAGRFFGNTIGWGTALIWGTSPVHVGSVVWAVGRVDSHTVPWILLSALFLVRWHDGVQRSRIPALVCFLLGLCSKELALVTPGVAAVLCFALANAGQRVRRAIIGSWPFFALVPLYFGLRYLLFDRLIGGYAGGTLSAVELAQGLGTWTLRETNPCMALTGAPLEQLGLPSEILAWWWVGFAPAAAGALWLAVRGRGAALLALLVLYVGCATPMVQFWGFVDNPQILRYFTLPFAALATLMAVGRIWTILPALVLAALPHLEARQDWIAAGDQARRVHERIAELASDFEPSMLFVAGLPRQTNRQVLMYYNGVDRILQPPFGDGRHRVFALRPFNGRSEAARIPYGETVGLPHGETFALMRDTGVFRLEPDSRPGVDVHVDGESHLSTPVLWGIHRGDATPSFVIGGARAPYYRITLFTAGGYITAILPNEAPAGTTGGRVSLKAWLKAGTTQNAFVLTELRVPTALDLEVRFPVLIEAGRPDGTEFDVTAVGRDWVWLQFDRDYAEFMQDS